MSDELPEEDGASAEPLLPAPTREQLTLLETVAGVYLEHSKWPRWEWVVETLERLGLDAAAVVATLPREPAHSYGYVSGLRPGGPQPGDEVRLTVAGLSQIPSADTRVKAFLRLVNVLGTFRAAVTLDPFSETRPTITKSEILTAIFPSLAVGPEVTDMLSREPPTWLCQMNGPPNSDWHIEVAPVVRRFAGVSTVEDYFRRFRKVVTPTLVAPKEALVSPFTLAASLDYLDAVWHMKFGSSILVPPGIERSARLAFDARSPEEADSRLSALAEVLKGMRVPGVSGVGGHALERLRPFLDADLPDESHERVHRAIEVLDAARTMRVGGQHVGAQAGVAEACARLGLSYPIADWSMAWTQIQSVVTIAIDAIRDEIQASM